MPAKKRPVYQEPQVIAAVLGVVSVIIAGVFNLLPRSATPSDDPSTSLPISLNPAGSKYAAQLLSEAQAWPLVAKDTFDSNRYGWHEKDSTSSKSRYVLSIEEGVYLWRVQSSSPEGSFLWPMLKTLDTIPDFYVAVDGTDLSDNSSGGYGLTFRNQSASNHYGFILYTSGDYEIHYYHNENETSVPTTLASLRSDVILPHGLNRLTVIGVGNQFWFFINDMYVNSITDEKLLTGGFGLVTKTTNDTDEILIAFDNFEVREAR